MFEIQTNDHHYFSKTIFLSVLILVLGIITWTNVFAQKVIKMSLPNDYIITVESGNKDGYNNIGSNFESEIFKPIYSGTEVPMTGYVTSGITTLKDVIDDISDPTLLYVRKIEALITVKGQETRMNMIDTMNKFLSNYPPEHPMYHTVSRILDSIVLGDVAYKLKYCTQFDGIYILELFGMPLDIYSTIKYNNQLKKCQITYQYPDQSIHICSLNEEQKMLLSRAMQQKQGLSKFVPTWAFESVVEGLLAKGICFESQKSILHITGTGSSTQGLVVTGGTSTTGTVTSWWRKRGK